MCLRLAAGRSTDFAFFDDQGYGWFSCVKKRYRSADGAAWKQIRQDPLSALSQPIVAPDQRVYGIAYDQMVRFEHNMVTAIASAADFAEQTLPSLGAFRADGTGIVATARSVNDPLVFYTYDGQAWTRLGITTELGFAEQDSIKTLHITRQDRILAGSAHGVFTFDGTRFTPLIGPDQLGATVKDIAETQDGQIWVGTDEGLYAWDGAHLTVHDRKNGLPSPSINDLAVDSAGNVWVATGFGIAVRRGDTWELVLPSTSDLADSNITALAVKGAPTVPAAPVPPKTATIKGRLMVNDTPAPKTQIELCSHGYGPVGDLFSTEHHSTPCDDGFFHQLTTTDEHGKYQFDQVPLGVYHIAYQQPGSAWQVVWMGGRIVALEAGAEEVKILNVDE